MTQSNFGYDVSNSVCFVETKLKAKRIFFIIKWHL